MWLGYLSEFRDYWTQGESLEDLQENLTNSNSAEYQKSERTLQ